MKIVGVCACPAGIAHTYMAAESLEMNAKAKGYDVKIETNGASGVENRLTDTDIESADYVIVAADMKVEMERFKGKKLIKVSVGDAIRKVNDIYQSIENDNVTIYEGE